jgi:serine/threonine protein kinase
VKEIQATEDAQEVAEHWEKEVKALRKMNGLNQEHIVHFVTAFRRHKEKGSEEHYLMFEWADGGNLRSLWKSKPSPILTALRVKDVIKQILGLAKALEAAHNLNRTGASYRHGDLKPENILVFGGGGWIGTLKIGDWGEASENEQVTEMRPSKTAAKYGTRRYEPPEVVTGVRAKWLGQPTRRRSRLYDIWAMGCIVLELLVWLMYGVDELNRFNQDLGNESFYQTDVVNGREVARVHSAAVRWMEKMALDPRCKVGTTALGDLLELVRTGLLVVKLPRRLGTNLSLISEKPRADSFVDGLSTGFTGMMAGISSHDEPTFSEPHTANIPSISFTAADPEPIRIPLQPEPEPEGPARFLATGFLNGVEAIDVEDEEEIYWDIQQHQQPAPENTFSIYHAPSPAPIGNYAEEDSDLSAAEMYQPASQGFLTPKEKSVGSNNVF